MLPVGFHRYDHLSTLPDHTARLGVAELAEAAGISTPFLTGLDISTLYIRIFRALEVPNSKRAVLLYLESSVGRFFRAIKDHHDESHERHEGVDYGVVALSRCDRDRLIDTLARLTDSELELFNYYGRDETQQAAHKTLLARLVAVVDEVVTFEALSSTHTLSILEDTLKSRPRGRTFISNIPEASKSLVTECAIRENGIRIIKLSNPSAVQAADPMWKVTNGLSNRTLFLTEFEPAEGSTAEVLLVKSGEHLTLTGAQLRKSWDLSSALVEISSPSPPPDSPE